MANEYSTLTSVEEVQASINLLREGNAPQTIDLDNVDVMLVHNNNVQGTLRLLHQFFGECSSLFPECLIDLKIQLNMTIRPIPFPVELVASLLNQIPNQLKSLHFWNVALQGDISPLQEALGGQGNLIEFQCQVCPLNETDPVALASSLASCCNLKTISFETWYSNITNQVSLEMAIHCVQSPDLELLNFVGLCGESATLLLEALESAPGPKGLDLLHVTLQASQMNQLTRMLQRNTSLETLKIRVGRDASLEPITVGLQNNTTLKTLQIDLVRNWGLDEIDLFLALLETHNFSLGALNVRVLPLYLDAKTRAKGDRILFLLRLNHNHRRKELLMEETTLELLMDAIASTDDLSVIMYYLDQKCSLWIPSNH